MIAKMSHVPQVSSYAPVSNCLERGGCGVGCSQEPFVYRVSSITIDDLPEFAALSGDDREPLTQVTSELWSKGHSWPEWCFILERDGQVVGSAGFCVIQTARPELLGSLPPDELFLFTINLLSRDEDYARAGRLLLANSLTPIAEQVPPLLEARTNNEVNADHTKRRALFEGVGMTLFQEKEGFVWQDDGQMPAVPERLQFRSLEEVGQDEHARVMGGSIEGTLDRNDRYYHGLAGPENWAKDDAGNRCNGGRCSALAPCLRSRRGRGLRCSLALQRT